MTLKERWQARETAAGKWIKNWIGKALLFCTAIGSSLDYLRVIPDTWIPDWLKALIPLAGLTAFVVGKMSVKDVKNTAAILIMVILCSCTTNQKLREAKKLITEAQAKGATMKHDTVYQVKTIVGQSTTIEVPGKDTTIYVDKILTTFHTVHDTVHHTTKLTEYIKCPDNTTKNAIAVTDTILCDDHRYRWLGIGSATMLAFIGLLVWLVSRFIKFTFAR